MSRIDQDVEVPSSLAGERFDWIAAQLFADFSRAQLSRWISSGELTVDGAQLKPKVRLSGGETLALHANMPRKASWDAAEALVLDVLYEDDSVLVINKPAGLVVHPGAGNLEGTLVNGLLHRRPELAHLARAGVVHRLDKDTSGVMVVAASPAAQLKLTKMIAAREFERTYVAVCEGRMVAGQDIDQPIGRDPKVRTRQAVREDGKPAQTSVRVRERFRSHTLIEARLHTGRTHQIRVHLQSIGYPLVGDRRYGARGRVPPGASAELIATLHGFARQALHAETLGFVHPEREEWLEFEAPWPEDFSNLVDQLRDDA